MVKDLKQKWRLMNMFKVEDYDNNKYKQVKKNISDYRGSYAGFFKSQRRIHFWFKYVLLRACIAIGKRVFKKRLKRFKELPDEPQYKNIKIFRQSVEDALFVWADVSICLDTINQEGHNKKAHEFYAHSKSAQAVRDMADIIVSYVITDTAYFNLMDILMFKIAENMNAQHPPKAPHILHDGSSIADTKYFVTHGIIGENHFDIYSVDSLRVEKKPKRMEL